MKLKVISVRMLLLVVCLLAGFTAGAQQTLIDVKVDTADILVGEQTTLHVTVTTDPNRRIIIPLPSDTLMTGVEVISVSDADSTVADGRLVIRRDILVTSFDSSLYLLPPFIAIEGTDTIASNQVALKVSTVPVDVDNPEKFYDIKDVWKPPFVLADYYPWIFGVLTALFLICVIGYLVQRYRRHRSEVPVKPAEPELPPYETAIRELDSIKDQKLWQQGLNKEYYTQVTDTLRRYISRRYGVNAMEKTSEEILAIIERETDERSVYDTLRQVLRLSDYVKFAKLHPLPEENDESMRNAYLFVNQTKRAEAPQPDEAAPETVTKEDKK